MISQEQRTFRKPFTAILAATFLVTGLCCSLAPTAHAEVPPRKLEDLKKTADLIVLGKVRGVKRVRREDGQGTVTRDYLITVNVTETEKGTVTTRKNQIVTRGYTVLTRPDGNVGPSGHYTTDKMQRLSILKNGSRVRMYLTKRPDTTYDIIRPNGFELLRK
jgi:hypothetical protein